MIKDDLQKVWSALALYISMVRSGEIESPSSVAAKDEAFAILEHLLAESEPIGYVSPADLADKDLMFFTIAKRKPEFVNSTHTQAVYLCPPPTKPASSEMPTPDSLESELREEFMKTFTCTASPKIFKRDEHGRYINKFVEDDWQRFKKARVAYQESSK